MDKLIDLDHFSPTVICKITLLIVDSFSFFSYCFYCVYLVYVCVCVYDCLSAF